MIEIMRADDVDETTVTKVEKRRTSPANHSRPF
jgi:hypothetical protein